MVAFSSESVNVSRQTRCSIAASSDAMSPTPSLAYAPSALLAAESPIASQASLTQAANQIADRLERLGLDPFYSDRERYFVLLEERPGDIIELGRPLRGSRLFKKSNLSRDIDRVCAIESFADACNGEEWLYWNVSLPGAKAAVGNLVEANREFNRLINVHFTEMRRRNGFELILLVIHPRFDPISGKFDLHAHFICRIPGEHREAASRRLLTAFSKAHVPEERVRNPGACATYMIWGICRPNETAELPDDALSDLWQLSRSKARLVRNGSRLSKWRRDNCAAVKDPESVRQELLRRERRKATNSTPRPEGRDRLLVKTKATINGKRVAVILFERLAAAPEGAVATAPVVPEQTSSEDSSSATSDTTQDSIDDTAIDVVDTGDRQQTDVKGPVHRVRGGAWSWKWKSVLASIVAVLRPTHASTTGLRSVDRRWPRCRGPPRRSCSHPVGAIHPARHAGTGSVARPPIPCKEQRRSFRGAPLLIRPDGPSRAS